VDTGTVKLADFGASTKMAFGETQSTSTIKGTVIYRIMQYITLHCILDVRSCSCSRHSLVFIIATS
jgi:hypothetical protein